GLGGVTTDSDTVIVRYTLAGDANLDGQVSSSDFDLLASNFNQTASVWSAGDSNYDGNVNMLDFNLLSVNYGASLPAATLGTLVPEPFGAATACAAVALSMRRCRRWLV